MKSHVLLLPGLILAGLGGLAAIAGVFSNAIRHTIIYPTTWLVCGGIVILFLRALLDRRCRNGLNSIRSKVAPRLTGTPLAVLTTMLWLLFLVTLFLSILGGQPLDIALLAGASFGVSLMLTMVDLGLRLNAAS
jgi:hypothetical protein